MNCPFCSQENIDFLKIAETENAILIANRFPANNFHFLVIPRKHYTKVEEMPEEDWLGTCSLIYKSIFQLCCQIKYKDIYIFFNEGKLAGQNLKHFHWHIVVKTYDGDSFSLAHPRKNIKNHFHTQREENGLIISTSHFGYNLVYQIMALDPATRGVHLFLPQRWLGFCQQIRETTINLKGMIKMAGLNGFCVQKRNEPFTFSLVPRERGDDYINPRRGNRCRTQEIKTKEIEKFRDIFKAI